MIFKSQTKFTPKSRIRLAEALANMLNWQVNLDEVPYAPDAEDDSYWIIDNWHNWRIKFLDDNLSFQLTHQYAPNVTGQMEILGEWLVMRFGFTKI